MNDGDFYTMLVEFKPSDIIAPDFLTKARQHSIWEENSPGYIYLGVNAKEYGCTLEGDALFDEQGEKLKPEDELYQKIVGMTMRQAANDDTILPELGN